MVIHNQEWLSLIAIALGQLSHQINREFSELVIRRASQYLEKEAVFVRRNGTHYGLAMPSSFGQGYHQIVINKVPGSGFPRPRVETEQMISKKRTYVRGLILVVDLSASVQYAMQFECKLSSSPR